MCVKTSNLVGFEQFDPTLRVLDSDYLKLHRPSSKGTKLLLQVIKAIINQFEEIRGDHHHHAQTYIRKGEL